ncbi:unnamed protein product, partial [Ixodes persulcatus]
PGETGGQRPGAALPRPLSPLGPVGCRRPGSPGVAPSAEQTSVGPRAAPSDRPITRRGGAKCHEYRAHKESLMGRAARVLHQCQRPCGVSLPRVPRPPSPPTDRTRSEVLREPAEGRSRVRARGPGARGHTATPGSKIPAPAFLEQ